MIFKVVEIDPVFKGINLGIVKNKVIFLVLENYNNALNVIYKKVDGLVFLKIELNFINILLKKNVNINIKDYFPVEIYSSMNVQISFNINISSCIKKSGRK